MHGAEEDLRARGNHKKKNIWTKVAGKSTDDFEKFIALNSIKEQRKELEIHGFTVRQFLMEWFCRCRGENAQEAQTGSGRMCTYNY